MSEAERLEVDCEGDLTRRAIIKMCKMDVEAAQSRERQAELREDNARLDADIDRLREDNARLDEELRKKVEALANMAEKKLNQ